MLPTGARMSEAVARVRVMLAFKGEGLVVVEEVRGEELVRGLVVEFGGKGELVRAEE